MRIWIVVALVALSGCFGDAPADAPDEPADDPDDGVVVSPGTPTTPPTRATPMLVDFHYEGCEGAYALYEADPDDAQALLPEGYTVTITDGLLAPVTPVAYLMVICDVFRAPSATLNDTVLAWLDIPIERPANVTAAADWYRYRARMMVSDDTMEAVWRVAGYDVYRGDFSQSQTPAGGTVTLGEYASDGLFAQATVDQSFTVARFTETAAGRLDWTENVTWSSMAYGAGSLEVAADDPLARSIADDPAPSWSVFRISDAAFVDIDLLRYP